MKHLQLYENFIEYKTIAIYGLPGSGKSALAKEIIKLYPSMDYVVYDDFKYKDALQRMGQENQIISDGMLHFQSKSELVNRAESTNTELQCIYFANDTKQAEVNYLVRSQKADAEKQHKYPSQIQSLTKAYGEKIPVGEITVPIWRPGIDMSSIVKSILG